MAVSIKELIEQQDAVKSRKQQRFDIETSVGVITVKQPTRAMASELADIEDSDAYLIMECTVEPNLKDKTLMEAYGCAEPLDVPVKLFKAGEVSAIARRILESADFRKDVKMELHDAVKN